VRFIVNYGIGSNTIGFSLDSASDLHERMLSLDPPIQLQYELAE
jgi:hypothetical protein